MPSKEKSEKKYEMLREAGFSEDFIAEIQNYDKASREAGVTDELIRKTVEYAGRPRGTRGCIRRLSTSIRERLAVLKKLLLGR